MYESGARSFLFLTVPPTNRAPLLIEQGSAAVAKITSALADYNAQLAANVKAFQATHHDLDQVTVFDTRPIFNLLLDNAQPLGFVNSTGFCEAYENGTPSITTQVAPCAPVSSYLCVFKASRLTRTSADTATLAGSIPSIRCSLCTSAYQC